MAISRSLPGLTEFLDAASRVDGVVSKNSSTGELDAEFHKALEQHSSIPGAAKVEAFRLLHAATSLHLRPENASEPFGVKWVFDGRRSASLHDFSDEEITLFSSSLEQIRNTELRARLADICWLIKRDHSAASLGIG